MTDRILDFDTLLLTREEMKPFIEEDWTSSPGDLILVLKDEEELLIAQVAKVLLLVARLMEERF